MKRVKPATESPEQQQAPLLVKYLLPVVIIVLLLGAYLTYRAWMGGMSAGGTDEKSLLKLSDLEERYGIQPTLVGVTAAGGLVDFRFRVLDAAKAQALVDDPRNLPALVTEDGSVVLLPPDGTLKDAMLENGLVYFILYPNTRGIIMPGKRVLVQIGEERYGLLEAQ